MSDGVIAEPTDKEIASFVKANFRVSDSMLFGKLPDPVIGPHTKIKLNTEPINDDAQRAALCKLLGLHADHIHLLTSTGRILVTPTKTELICELAAVRAHFGGKRFVDIYTKTHKAEIKAKRAAEAKAAGVPTADDAKAAATTKAAAADATAAKKDKKDDDDDKRKRKSADMTAASDDEGSGSDSDSSDDDDDDGAEAGDDADKPIRSSLESINEKRAAKRAKQAAKRRYILFVGNLPFDYGESKIRELFHQVELKGVRVPTDPQTQQPKGYVFAEFHNARDLHYGMGYHHSTVQGRRINVELTAGGGGTGKARTMRIAAKKQRIGLERHEQFVKRGLLTEGEKGVERPYYKDRSEIKLEGDLRKERRREEKGGDKGGKGKGGDAAAAAPAAAGANKHKKFA